MQVEQLAVAEDGRRTIAVVLAAGDEFVACMEAVVRDEAITGASFTAIGAFERARLGYFRWDTKAYTDIPIDGQVEVASMIGNVARKADGTAVVHAHCVVSTETGEARAGHVLEGHVRPTLEVVIEESPVHLVRRHDPVSGLSLIDLDPPG